MNAIQTEKLTKYYGKTCGVADVDLAVRQGEVFGFIGPNGAGKSTTIRVLMQLIQPTSGSMTVLGECVTGDNPRLRRRIGYLPSEINYYRDLTGRQVLQLAARIYGVTAPRIEEYAALLDINLAKTVKSYSLGNRKKLAIIQILLHDPDLLILDEPTSGLDPLMQNRFFELLRELNGQGKTIFLSTHVLSEVERLCDRVAFIRDGRVIQVSPVDEIPGRSERLIEVRFSEPGNLIAKNGFTRLDPKVEYRDGWHIFHARGHLHEELRHIAEYPIDDISVRQPTLEELFMQYYHGHGNHTVNSHGNGNGNSHKPQPDTRPHGEVQ